MPWGRETDAVGGESPRSAASIGESPFPTARLQRKLLRVGNQHCSLLDHRSRSWQERESGNLQIFKAIRYSAAITVSTIIVLAGFGIFNILTLMVLEKVREIAILRSMGYRRGDISAIFLWQGLLIAAIGSTAGCILGALMTWGVSRIPVRVRGFFAVDHFLVYWSWHHYLAAIGIAFVGVFLASYFPARRAAKLAPVTILRGSGQ